MFLTERVYESCKCCGKSGKLLKEETYGCNECRKEIDIDGSRLEVTVFSNTNAAERRHFCSWKCVVKNIRKIKTDYFVSLPYLLYDDAPKGMRVADFIKLLKVTK